MKKLNRESLLLMLLVITTNIVVAQTKVFFTKTGSEKVLMAKLADGNVYYNTATINTITNPKWSVLMKYDNSWSIIDMNNVAVMNYNGDEFRTLNGFSSDGQGNREYLYSTGFNLINNQTALSQFCGGQKFVIERDQSGKFYYIKFPSNYYYESSYGDIIKSVPNLTFEIVSSKSVRLDFAIIFFLIKFAKQDIDPCE